MPRRIGSTSYDENFPGSDITPDEWEFIQAVRAYQLRFKRRYPSWREVLGVLESLGYRKVAPPCEGGGLDIRMPKPGPGPGPDPPEFAPAVTG